MREKSISCYWNSLLISPIIHRKNPSCPDNPPRREIISFAIYTLLFYSFENMYFELNKKKLVIFDDIFEHLISIKI